MSPAVKYTLGRVGLFVAALALMLPLPLDLYAKLLAALLVSFLASFVLLRRWKDEMVGQIDGAVRRRRDRKEDLRAALAGDDELPAGTASADPATQPVARTGEPVDRATAAPSGRSTEAAGRSPAR